MKSLSLFTGIFLTYHIFGQVEFREKIFQVFDNVYQGSIAYADTDGDGDIDVLITGYSNSSQPVTQLYRNDGAGIFSKVSGTPFEKVSSGASAFADIDGDGDQDLLLTGYNLSNQRITKLYQNNGTGIFSEVQNTPFEGVNFSSVAFADIDNDGDQDLLITGYSNSNTRTARLYKNNGTGTFSEVQNTPFEGVAFGSVAFTDIDNDGDLDLLITGENNSEQPVSKLYLNNGTGIFTGTTGMPFTGVSYSSIAVADIDNDGDPDVLVTGKINPNLEISKLFINNGTGIFSELAGTPFQRVYNSSVAFEDVDNDGDQDILIAGYGPMYGSPTFKLYTNNGTGTYSEVTDHPFKGIKTGMIAAVDIDNDGDTDVLSIGINISNEGISRMYTNDGNGKFTDTSTPFIDLSNSLVDFADIDGDGDEDVLVSGNSEFNERRMALYRNDGAGNFSIVENTPFTAVRNRGKIQFSDIDNDGDEDLLIMGLNNLNQGVVKLYSNDGTGVFTEVTGTPFAQISGTFAFADIDNDGDKDLFLSGSLNNTPFCKFYLNNDGTFTEAPGISVLNMYFSAVAFSDIDNDGDMDLLITGATNVSSNRITKLYINDGMGAFTEAASIPFENVSDGSIAFTDVDNDGDEDVMISGVNNSNGRITKLYFNDGSGNFSEDTNNWFPGVYFSTITFEDVDNDGDKDLLLTGMTGSQNIAKLYINEGTGIFTELFGMPFVPVEAGAAAFSDIDNDGDMDVLISGSKATVLYENISCLSVVDTSVSLLGETIIANQPNASYNWLDCENNYLPVGVTTQSFTPEMNGSYAVEITQTGGCVARSSCIQIANVGISENKDIDDLVIYPNPTDEQLTIKTSAPIQTYSILDLQGRILREEYFTNNVIDLSDLSAGSYVIVLKSKDLQVVRNIIKK